MVLGVGRAGRICGIFSLSAGSMVMCASPFPTEVEYDQAWGQRPWG